MLHHSQKGRSVVILLSLFAITGVCSSCGGGDAAALPEQAVAATPTFAAPAGTYATDQSVAIGCASPDATIYYTTDGRTPTAGSTVYATPIPVTGEGTVLTIKAIAVKAGMLDSDVASATYVISASGVKLLLSYPPRTSGGFILSSWVSPNGSDKDVYAYNDFALPVTSSITEVRWRGGYSAKGVYGVATDFTVTFFATNATGVEPLVASPDSDAIFLAKYQVGGNVSVTLVGEVGLDQTMYDYRYQLPTPFQAVGGTKYWLRIEALQPVYPDWGIAVGTGGDGMHFQYDAAGGQFRFAPYETSFMLLGN